MSVGVVIPAYNAASELIEEALRSVERQVPKTDCEVVVVDDGSESAAATERACRATALTNLELVRLPKHEGMAAARNEGVARLGTDFVVLLDSDDLLTPTALYEFERAATPEAHLIYADHLWCELDGTVLAERRKSDYQVLLERYAQTQWTPFLHATFLFHPQVYRTTTYRASGGLTTEWGYGDEIELHLKIEAEVGSKGIRHIPTVLYHYRRNPTSVVHDPALYARLIENIESMLLGRMRVFESDVERCSRIGRAQSTHAAHYAYWRDEGDRVDVPWFDFDSLDICNT